MKYNTKSIQIPILLGLLVVVSTSSKADNDAGVMDYFAILEAATHVSTNRDEIGGSLVQIVNHSDVPPSARHRAIRKIAELNYEEGVGCLIGNIDFIDPTIIGGVEMFSPEFHYPCVGSLIRIGDACLKPVIAAASSETDPKRLDLYKHVLRVLNTKSGAAKVLLQSKILEVEQPSTAERLNDLLSATDMDIPREVWSAYLKEEFIKLRDTPRDKIQ